MKRGLACGTGVYEVSEAVGMYGLDCGVGMYVLACDAAL